MKKRKFSRIRRGIAILAAAAALGMAGTASAINIGVGTVIGPGGNTGIGPSGDLLWLHDYLNTGNNPVEGWGDASTDWMLDQLTRSGLNPSPRDFTAKVRTACQGALRDAVARAGGRTNKARVVGLIATVGVGSDGKAVLWGDNKTDFNNRFQNNWNARGTIGGPRGSLHNWSNNDVNELHNRANETISRMSGVSNQAVCLAVNEFEPPDLQQYHLNVHTNSTNAPKEAGDTNPVHDRIVASLNRGESWSGSPIRLGVWLNWDGYPASNRSRKAIRKEVTLRGPSTVNSPDFKPSDFGWKSWAPGRYWYDISAGRQGNMAASIDTSDRQSAETFSLPTLPPLKALTRMNGQEMDGQLVPGTLYMAHVTGTVAPAVSGYNTRSTITDHIMSKDVWVGAADHDDLTKVTVSHDGQTVTSGVHVTRTDTADGIDVTATIDNPAEGEYTLNIPSTIKAKTGDGKDKTNETIRDRGCIIANTGASEQCSDTKQEQGEHPETSKAWQLKDGKLIEDKDWTNHVGADGTTFLPGDPVSAIVTGNIPGNLLENLDRYELTDDWSNASQYVDFGSDAKNPNHKVSVYVDGTDATNQFDIHEDASAHTVTADAKKAFLNRTKGLSKDGHRAKVQLRITGTFRDDYRTNGRKTSMVNHGSQRINTEGRQTNVPSVFTWTPNPNKEWARNTKLDGTGDWTLVSDPNKSNNVAGDQKNYRDGDPLAAAVNGTVPTGLGEAPRIALTDDWTQASYMWTPDDLSKARVYEADLPAGDDGADAKVDDITHAGRDVTGQYTLTMDKAHNKVTATIKDSHATELKGLTAPRQITLLVPGRVALAYGKGNRQFDHDYGLTKVSHKTFTDASGRTWYRTCFNPNDRAAFKGTDLSGKPILNDGGQTAGAVSAETNRPGFCVVRTNTKKTVVAEKSQGGDQHDSDTQRVRPNQRVEYQLDPVDKVEASDAYTVQSVSIHDTYSEHATVDPQTIEVRDTDGDDLVSGTDYQTAVDNAKHEFTIVLSQRWVSAHYRPGQTIRLHVRFEAQLDDLKGLGERTIDNRYEYKVNNATNVSNTVRNKPTHHDTKKEVTQSNRPSVDINGRKLLLGDEYDYRLDFDTTDLTNGWSRKNDDGTITRGGEQVYRVQRLGMTDDYDDEHLSVDAGKVRVLDQDGHDVTGKFNIQIQDGVLYVFARTVDTPSYAGLGTIKGDPQPTDLKAYSTKALDRLRDPYIDQTLLGKKYTIVMPSKVIKVEEDGVEVDNQAVLTIDDQKYLTNQVQNVLKRIDPKKDVVINVGQDSANGKSVYKGHYFLYRLQSSKRPSGLAYPEVTDWHITDRLDSAYDRYTAQWAVYADTDLKKADGTLIAKAGQKIAGSGWTPTDAIRHVLDAEAASSLFDVRETTDHIVQVTATQAYKALVSDGRQDAQWSAYIQVQRLKPVEHHNNRFDEWINGTLRPSNVVWTRTPDQTPHLTLEKYDVKSGLKEGDRNKPEQALDNASDGTRIGFRITNDGKSPITKITLDDRTIAGSGTVEDIDLTPLKGLTLQPGQSVTVYGTLRGVKAGDHHTDRGTTTGRPLLPCAVPQPGFPDTSAPAEPSDDGQPKLCEDTRITVTDDWNGRREPAPALAKTGAAVASAAVMALVLLSAGLGLGMVRRHGVSAPEHKIVPAHKA